MTEISFYHLEQSRLEGILPGLLEKTLENGWQATVRTGSGDLAQKIDELLWTYSDETFLPHGTSDEGEGHPVWITDGMNQKDGAELLFLVGGAGFQMAELDRLTRCIMIFDGADEDAVSAARDFWKEAKAASHEVTYWKQSSAGKWEKQG